MDGLFMIASIMVRLHAERYSYPLIFLIGTDCSVATIVFLDVHHRIPQSNYGQYTVFWDRIFGTFREYNNEDRINPAYQLDPSTGKTLSSVKSQ